MRFFSRLDSLDVRWFYLLLAVVVIWPMFKPFGLPIVVNDLIRQAYGVVESLTPGSYVFLSIDFDPSTATENASQAKAVARHCFTRGMKVLVGSGASNAQGVQQAQGLVQSVSDEMGKQYGVDWVNFGYKAGGIVYIRAMIDDIIAANVDEDFTGQALTKMPIMQGIKSLRECQLLTSFTAGGGTLESFVQFLYNEYQNKIVGGVSANMIATQTVYVQSGQYAGLIGGLVGAAQYEYLLGKPDKAITGMDSQSAAHILFTALILLGNIGLYVKSRRTV